MGATTGLCASEVLVTVVSVMVGLSMYVIFISQTAWHRVAPRINPSWHLTRRCRLSRAGDLWRRVAEL